jgi:hypothetical protein
LVYNIIEPCTYILIKGNAIVARSSISLIGSIDRSLCAYISRNIEMASTSFLLVTLVLLLSLIVIASANDYGYAPKPDYEEKPKPETPDFEKSNPAEEDNLLPTIIGIQGTVLCKLGSKIFPLKGT